LNRSTGDQLGGGVDVGSSDFDNELPEGATFPEVAQRLGHNG